MNITDLAIRNDRVVFVVLLGILVWGATTFLSMPRSESPPYIVRNAQIVTRMPGASPERVELLVTDKLEKSIREMPEVDFVTSTSKTGISIVIVAIKESYTDMRPIWDDLRRKVEDAERQLPDSATTPDVNTDLGRVYEVTYAMTGEGFSFAEMFDIAEEIRDELLLIDTVSEVQIVGRQEERVFIEYDTVKLADMGLSPSALQSILSAQNITSPGGQILTDHETIVIEPSGNFESVEDVARALLQIPGRSDLVFLSDIAKVRRGYTDPPETLVYLNGEKAISISASLRTGGNVVEMGDEISKTMKRMEGVYPIGVEFKQIVNVPKTVAGTIDDFVGNLYQAIAVVLIVMLLFLGLRTGMVVVTLIPMTMIATIALMGVFDIGLDQVSLAALIIALGMLVDNAIVMSEAVLVRMRDGEKARDAAIASASELRVPLLVASLTTSAAFLPIALAESAVGEFCISLFKVVTIALLCSWGFSITMIPLFCVLFIKVAKSSSGEAPSKGITFYRRFIRGAISRPYIPLVAAVFALFGALSSAKYLDNVFFPPAESNWFTVNMAMPTGTPISKTNRPAKELDAFLTSLAKEGEVADWGTYVGTSIPAYGLGTAAGPTSSDAAMFMVNTENEEVRDSVIQKVRAFCAGNFPDLKTTVEGASNGPGGGTPVAIRLYGRDIGTTFEIADALKQHIRSVNGTFNIEDDWGPRSKKLEVRIDQDRAKRAGVTSQDIAVSLRTVNTGLTVSEYREADQAIPIVLRAIASERFDINRFKTLNVVSQQSGVSVPLSQVADVVLVWENAKQLRRDGLTAITVSADLVDSVTAAEAVSQIAPWLETESKNWSVGYKYEVGGENEQSDDANQSIMDKLPLAGLLILLLLISQFNSLRRATIVLSTIPLGLIGVIPGLLLFQQAMGFMTLLGIISLAGIVINNAIVLLDRIRIEEEENGFSPFEAVIEAGAQRIRPILLTTVTTITGLIPLYLGGGAMWESMAIAIMAGLLMSTVLTLVVIPSLYVTLFRVKPEVPLYTTSDQNREKVAGVPEHE